MKEQGKEGESEKMKRGDEARKGYTYCSLLS